MILSQNDLAQTIRPLVYGVADPDGVTKALVHLVMQDREACSKESIGKHLKLIRNVLKGEKRATR